jgi:hypothetical protein
MYTLFMPIKILSKLWYNNSESESDSEYKFFSLKYFKKKNRVRPESRDPRSPRKTRTPI